MKKKTVVFSSGETFQFAQEVAERAGLNWNKIRQEALAERSRRKKAAGSLLRDK